MKNLIVILAIFLSMFVSYQFTNAQWVQRYNGPANSSDGGTSIVVDESGNVYVSGGSIGIGGLGNNQDYVTIKYNSSGVEQWVQRYNATDREDYPFSLAVDVSGNSYVTGVSLDFSGSDDIATIKYNSSGIQQWVQRYDRGRAGTSATSITVDGSGYVYVTGRGYDVINSNYYVTIKYDLNGDSVWVRRYSGSVSDEGKSIAVDRFGNVYVTGNITGDYGTIKYNSNGVLLWDRRYNGGDYDQAESMSIDSSGNVYVTGSSSGFGYATIKYNTNGDLLWIKKFGGSHYLAKFIATDDSGNVYVTGGNGFYFATIKYNSIGDSLWVKKYGEQGNDYNIARSLKTDDLGNIYITGSSGNDCVTIKYNSSGNEQWIRKYDGPAHGDDHGICLAVDSSENVYITGASYGIGSSSDFLTIKYSQDPTTLALVLTSLIEGLYNNVTDKMLKDTARANLRNATSPYSIVDSAKSVLDSNGNGTFNFPYTFNRVLYYIVIKHRSSIEIWSSQGIMFTDNQFSYDFTSAANKAYGSNLVLKGSKFCIYSGDINQDGIVDLSDLTGVDNDAYHLVSGYKTTDVNGDNIVDLSDLSIADNNALNFVSRIRP